MGAPPYTRRTAPPLRDAVHRVGRGTQISYIGLLLAVLTGILHAAVAPVIAIGDVHPNLVLVAVVAVTVVKGFGPGVAWAFVAGLTANLLTREPLGSIPLGLLVVAVLTAGGARLFGRLSWAYPVAAVALGSLVVDAISLGVLLMVDQPGSSALPLQRIAAAGILNAAIAAIVILPARLLIERAGAGEKPAW
jgi:rod shape-determining protein MreD